uniref:Uncharacterized protein n=1 Tax=Solanum lycopersicum TaxID=4081 RepID=A0A3Q7J7M1_SOLLC
MTSGCRTYKKEMVFLARCTLVYLRH